MRGAITSNDRLQTPTWEDDPPWGKNMSTQVTTPQATLSTRRSEAMWREACKHSPMGAQGEGKYYAPYPLFIERARGAYLWDVDGNRYIDYWNGAGPCVLGHGHPAVNEAVKQVLDEQGVLYCAPHRREMELASRL